MYLIKLNTLYLMSTNNKWTDNPGRALQFVTSQGVAHIARYYPKSTIVPLSECKSSQLQQNERTVE